MYDYDRLKICRLDQKSKPGATVTPMRFIAFSVNGMKCLGLESPAGELRGHDNGRGPLQGTDLLELLRQGPAAISAAGRALADAPVIDPGKITFLPPMPRAPKIICVGLNYADHTKESPYEQPKYPTLFSRFNSTLVGHGAPIIRPRVSEQLDYEGELVVVIGKAGRHISETRALEHVAGYSIFNDASIRDYQFKSPQWTVGKNFDGTGAFGPALVTSDELPNGARGLMLQTRLNGQVVQKANTADMLFDVVSLIAIISEAMTFEVGDMIVSGTPAGVGFARKPPLFMRGGDVCEVEIEGLGVLRNPIVDEVASESRVAEHVTA
jgi:2-keto-4-pentenoate hydratase/2-oxohepta-3-ene-1,7-dioic acid hydratase in catechol pathway